jgi:thioredoxin reductase
MPKAGLVGRMPRISDTAVIVGDGPTGLQCALLLAKTGIGVHVLGLDETPTNKAVLHNYLGVDGAIGPNFMELARDQAERVGVHIHRQRVTLIERARDGFRAVTEEGNQFDGKYLVLAHGRNRALAEQLGLEMGSDGVTVDQWGHTSVPNVYAGGWQTRGARIQVAISVGDGAAIALDILGRERGAPTHDFDVMEAAPKAAAPNAGAPSSTPAH